LKTGCWGICSFLFRIRVKGLISWVQHLKLANACGVNLQGQRFERPNEVKTSRENPNRKIRIEANILIVVHWVYLEHEEKTQSRWFGLQSFALSK
jgi:hypothetical protein